MERIKEQQKQQKHKANTNGRKVDSKTYAQLFYVSHLQEDDIQK